MKFIYNDGGRSRYFKAERVGDCVTRAIANATGIDYKEVYNSLNKLAKSERTGKRKRTVSNSRSGVYSTTARKYLESLGWVWKPTMTIGSGCKVHLREDELPSGNLIVNVSKHYTCVKDGVLYDTYDCTRDGNRCVYGYYYKPNLDTEWIVLGRSVRSIQKQKFHEGDIAILHTNSHDWKVKVILPFQDDDSWYYEVECIDPEVSEDVRKNFHREVAQDRLQEA